MSLLFLIEEELDFAVSQFLDSAVSFMKARKKVNSDE